MEETYSFSNTWKGSLKDGEYEFRYDGSAVPVIKELIHNLQFHLVNLETGVVPDSF